jgi:hypothetical protein
VVAAPEQRSSSKTFELIQGSLSAGRVARRSPWLGGLHRLADGTMLGVLAAVAVLSGLTLHWQHRWTLSFNRLESTRSLAHRLTESTAVMEQHLLRRTTRPSRMVPTKVANLVYLNRPSTAAEPIPDVSMLPSFDELIEERIRPGY